MVETTASAPRIAHQPALDGIRGVAVGVILLFHSHFWWAQGAFLTLSTFFTLSGFLITTLLLVEHEGSGRIALGRFWARRMRRLMPAALLGLGLAVTYGAFAASADQLARLRGDVLWCLAYLANWRFIRTEYSYLALFTEPSPVLHFWSLGIEEQFYAVYPLLMVGALALVAGSRRALAAALALLVAASLAATAALAAAGASPDRIYFGTETRAGEFVVGGLLAAVLPREASALRAGARRAIAAVGAAALALAVFLWTWASLDSSWPYRGGLVGYGFVTAAIIAAAVQPGSAVRRLLSWGPLRWLGRISYGVYVYHWPVFLWLDEARTGLAAAPLFGLRLCVVLALAEASHRFVEHPIRTGRALTHWRPWLAGPLAAGALVASLLGVTAGVAPSAFDFTDTPEAAAVVPAASDLPVVPAFDEPPAVAVFGDSTALRLSGGVMQWLRETGLGRPLTGVTTVGCGLADEGLFRFRGKVHATKLGCGRIEEKWREVVERSEPDVAVVLMGHWDLHDRRLPGSKRWIAPGDPAFDAYLGRELRGAVEVLASRGATVVWLTIPHDAAGGDSPIGVEPDRVARYNALLREIAAERPDVVRVVDLSAHLRELHGEVLDRALLPDGIHMTPQAAYDLTASWIGPELLRAHHATSDH